MQTLRQFPAQSVQLFSGADNRWPVLLVETVQHEFYRLEEKQGIGAFGEPVMPLDDGLLSYRQRYRPCFSTIFDSLANFAPHF